MESCDKENTAVNANVLIFSPPKALKDRADTRQQVAVQKEVPSMLCAKFSKAMHVEFQLVAVGSFNSMNFLLINPNSDKAVSVSVDKIPTEKGFDILLGPQGSRELEIAANSKMHGVITWNPTCNMGVCEKAVLKLSGKTPLQINLRGKAGTGKSDAVARSKPDRKALVALAPRDLASMKPKKDKVTTEAPPAPSLEDAWANKQALQFQDWLNGTFAKSYASSVELEKDFAEGSGNTTPTTGIAVRTLVCLCLSLCLCFSHTTTATNPPPHHYYHCYHLFA